MGCTHESRQTIYMIWLLAAEVNNGGYNQSYFNSSRKFYTHLPNALKLIGADKFADLTKQANMIFEKRNHETISQSDDGDPLNKLDDEFFELYKTEDLQQMQAAYIRKHKAAFIDK
ncbi:DUF4375 domain-containing protein [Chitinophaga sp. XS-30]|uniref:DMP19 family protein n=1 Tax=Chitinophaga sp. XS-30 TaxID=2604421 RepID=UPI0011DD74DF|nr:DUF4375 domain-containing protein [Chitinophaga sp. XS-30]QEH42687.1 DUF4375 domain-containing protein [Chitinophaga sp. XS-30]